VEGRICEGLARLGVPAPEGACAKLARYGELLLEKNQVMNLTAITEPQQVADLHFLDSAAVLLCADLKGRRVIDVGTGAGFPGLVLKILEPSIRLTLLDGLEKRLKWLNEVCRELSLEGVETLHARAEEASLKPPHREGYDIATARAVADLRLLGEMCLPYVRPGGLFLAMKSTTCGEELAAAGKGLALLGGKVKELYDYSIPGTEVAHRVVVVEKAAPTPKGYPRRWAKMQKSPL